MTFKKRLSLSSGPAPGRDDRGHPRGDGGGHPQGLRHPRGAAQQLPRGGTYKIELLQDGASEGVCDARAASFDYTDGYYNTRRKHSSIGYRTPLEYEHELITLN